MKALHLFFLIATYVIAGYGETFDLGDLKQYDPKTEEVPDGLQPDSIYITQQEGGFQILLGQDIKAKVDGALQGCREINDQCYQVVNNVLKNAHIQTDQSLEARQLVVVGAFISRVWSTLRALKGGIAALAVALWAGSKQPASDKGNFWPEAAANSAAKMPEATPITISAAGSIVATITQAPVETTLEGSITPAVTVVQSASEGLEKGDLVGVIDRDLANRLDEFMRRIQDCQAGREFDSKHKSLKRASGTYGQALCAAQSVMQGATADGPFNDLVLLDPASVHFRFTEAAGAAREAFNELADFITAYSPLISLPEDLVSEISIYVLALAIDTIVEGVPLGEQNRIKASLVSTTESAQSTSTSSCPEPTSIVCEIPEEEDCVMNFSDDDPETPVCKEGKHKDCECTPPPDVKVYFASKERQEFLESLNELLKKSDGESGGKKDPECSKEITPIPAALFSSKSMNVHSHFCDGWPSGMENSMTVNSKGEDVTPEPHLSVRDPSISPDTYKEWLFDLHFKASDGSGKCDLDCNEAFSKLSSTCALPKGLKFLPGLAVKETSMYEKGSIDVGCGTFSYNIHKPELTELKEFKQFCYKESDFDRLKGDGVDKYRIRQYSGSPCTGVALPDRMIKKGDKNSFIHWQTRTNKVPYQFNVWWKDGCTLADGGATELSAANPLLVEKPGYTVCQDSLYRNWKDCNNGGVGGNIQIGCLMYEFKADTNPREW